MTERIIYTDSLEQTAQIFGSYDCHSEQIEKAFAVRIHARDDERAGGGAIVIGGEDGEAVDRAYRVLHYLKRAAQINHEVTEQNVSYAIGLIEEGAMGEDAEPDECCICLTYRGKPIKAKTVGQQRYVDAIRKNTIVFGTGPAGTGKTYLAVAMAVRAFRAKEVSRIILTRPAVEAGEKLGFLPGDLQTKIDPYLRPLYDALYDTMGAEAFARLTEKGQIEIAPLAYMRGRTLDDSFIILDEAQNTTPEQMKMFLTRLGFRSKAVITGDLTQTDLPSGKKSGLAEAVSILEGIEGIAAHRFSDRDVVRHRLVQKIILAYQKYEEARERETSPTARQNTGERK